MKKKIAFALIMGSITTGFISFVLIAVNLGFTNNFLFVWLRSWMLSYSIVIPTLLLLAPRIQQLVERIFEEKNA